jgi:ABC-2 type transport system permease protein
MTTSTLPTLPIAGRSHHLVFSGILRSEWIKLFSLRSTVWLYAAIILISLALGALAPSILEDPAIASRAEIGQTIASGATFGILFSQLVIAALGAISMTGEYSSGQITSTLTAVPGRVKVLCAKAVILFLSSFVVGLTSAAGGAAIAALTMSVQGASVSLADPSFLASVGWAGFYLAMVSVFSLGVGTILRSTGGAIATVLGILLVLPIVFSLSPVTWMQDASAYLLSNAGQTLAQGDSTTWPFVLAVVGWMAMSLVIGSVMLRRRDA